MLSFAGFQWDNRRFSKANDIDLSPMQTPIRVKFCGITRPRDAALAVELGVDALGFVFHPQSPRYIDPQKAASIIAELPPFVTSIGLVVDRPIADVEEIIATTSIDMVQCHGDESAIDCERLSRPYIKAIRVKADLDVGASARIHQQARAILLDAYVPGIPGGSGQRFDWRQAQTEIAQPLIVAGGLDADGVDTAIEQLSPYAVDVSSGIESEPGHKDPQKMRAFMQKIRQQHGKY